MNTSGNQSRKALPHRDSHEFFQLGWRTHLGMGQVVALVVVQREAEAALVLQHTTGNPQRVPTHLSSRTSTMQDGMRIRSAQHSTA